VFVRFVDIGGVTDYYRLSFLFANIYALKALVKNYGINSLHFNLGQIKENKLSKNENYKISQLQTILTYIY
jgi:hypothetical protein